MGSTDLPIFGSYEGVKSLSPDFVFLLNILVGVYVITHAIDGVIDMGYLY